MDYNYQWVFDSQRNNMNVITANLTFIKKNSIVEYDSLYYLNFIYFIKSNYIHDLEYDYSNSKEKDNGCIEFLHSIDIEEKVKDYYLVKEDCLMLSDINSINNDVLHSKHFYDITDDIKEDYKSFFNESALKKILHDVKTIIESNIKETDYEISLKITPVFIVSSSSNMMGDYDVYIEYMGLLNFNKVLDNLDSYMVNNYHKKNHIEIEKHITNKHG